MGLPSSGEENQQCNGDVHVYSMFQCMNLECQMTTTICRNTKCGYKSPKSEEIWICETCRVKETMPDEEFDMNVTSGFALAASVSYNTVKKSF